MLEYVASDLEALIKDKSVIFTPADIKSWLLMALRGLSHCHSMFVIHRDLKPNNLLLHADGTLKIADFGLAREHAQFTMNERVMTSQVVTRWYRAPELLFGARHYGAAVDIWSLGCIAVELLMRTPYLPGNTDLDQIKTVFRARGTPTEEEWPVSVWPRVRLFMTAYLFCTGNEDAT